MTHFIETRHLELVLVLLVIAVILLATMPGKQSGDKNQPHRATGWRVALLLLAIAATALMVQYMYDEYITSEPVLAAPAVPSWLIVGLFAAPAVPVYLGFRYKKEGWSTGVGFLVASLAIFLVATSTAHMQYGGKVWTTLWYATGVALFSAIAVSLVVVIATSVNMRQRGLEQIVYASAVRQ